MICFQQFFSINYDTDKMVKTNHQIKCKHLYPRGYTVPLDLEFFCSVPRGCAIKRVHPRGTGSEHNILLYYRLKHKVLNKI